LLLERRTAFLAETIFRLHWIMAMRTLIRSSDGIALSGLLIPADARPEPAAQPFSGAARQPSHRDS
jgi:hypothetical protein